MTRGWPADGEKLVRADRQRLGTDRGRSLAFDIVSGEWR